MKGSQDQFGRQWLISSVIATKVGIPYYLKNDHNAFLNEPRNINDIKTAIQKCVNNNELRKKIINNGFELSKQVSIKIQTKKLISLIKKKL